MDYSPPGSSIHGIFQARILEWLAISFSRGSSQLRDRTQDSHTSGRLFHLSHLGIFILSLRGNYMSVVAVQSHSCVQIFVTPWTAAHQASLSFTLSLSLLKFMSIESVRPSNHLIISCLLLLLPSIFPPSRSFPVSQLFASGGQSIGASTSAPVLPMNIQS